MNERKLKSIFQERLEDLVFDKKKAAKLTQNQIADEIGIATSALSNYLNSDREAGAVAVYKIAKYFGVTADYLLGLENAPTHIEADICDKTGLDEKAVRQLLLYAVYAKAEQRDLDAGQLGQNGMFFKALNNLIANNAGIINDIAVYLFTEVDGDVSVKFTHGDYVVAIGEDKRFIAAGMLNVISEGLVKERDRLRGGGG
ncbi:MAG: helix-turn-helix domain-containing protein [Oscillospiraceae bacterium]|nr:helix-turn-helix domain-containing protein [Oscillospiraceae bacterium]